jgi:hypothetical protein
MTPPFSIGSLVEIIGPDKFHSRTFKITQSTGCGEFSAECMPWYPASSLRLVQPFAVGNLVEVIRAPNYDSRNLVGEKFVIDDVDGERCTSVGYPWIRADCLRLVGEWLKIGDYAEVILPGNSFTGKIGKVMDDSGIKTVVLYNMGVWNRENLRKLTPEEIQQHLHPVGECVVKFEVDTSEFEESLDKAVNKMWKLLVNERLSAIEKRLQVLEGERPEVIDGRVICPNAMFDPRGRCMFCGNGTDLCHDLLVREECEYEKVLDGARKG